MAAPAVPFRQYVTIQSDSTRNRPFRAPHHPPDVLHKLYSIARQLAPLFAICSFGIRPGLGSQESLRTLGNSTFTLRYILVILLLMLVWTCLFRAKKTEGRDTPRLRFLISQLFAVFAGTAACTLVLWAANSFWVPAGAQLVSLQVFALRCSAFGAGCVLFTALLYSIAYRMSPPQLYVILGTRRKAISAYKKLQNQGGCRGTVLGFIDPDGSHAKYLPCDYLGTLDKLESILVRNPVDMVYLALPLKSQYHTVQEAISICERIGVDYSVQPDIFETRLARTGHFPLRETRGFVYHMVHEDYRVLLKRVIDLVLASALLLLLSPLMLAITIIIKATSPGPVLFVQERYGRNRRRFRIYKFRSMVADAEQQMKHVETLNEAAGPIFKIRRDPRITNIGRILRRSSLDELPQLMNVIKGDMSLVGPRPMSLRDVHRFSEASLMRRFSVIPGITGLWQVSGRSNTNFETWMKLDLQYIDHWSLALDLRILLHTVPAVFSGTGAA
jgi:exopolysaccharide biosynthesis polyprenyl glycosylphosphotransferase